MIPNPLMNQHRSGLPLRSPASMVACITAAKMVGKSPDRPNIGAKPAALMTASQSFEIMAVLMASRSVAEPCTTAAARAEASFDNLVGLRTKRTT